MKSGSLRIGATCAIVALLAACGGGADTSKPFSQDDFNKSLASYMTAAGNNFDGFSADTALVGASECSVDNAGKPGAMVECKLGDGYDTQDDAMKAYTTQKDRMTKALPGDARGGEQKNAAPNTPVRFVALSGKGAAFLVLTKNNDKWVVGYVFQKAP
jgi:hypothetical protein